MKRYLQGFKIFRDIKCDIHQDDSFNITVLYYYKGILVNLDKFLNYFKEHNLPLIEESINLKDAAKLL
jgi:hypothetical protein